MLATAIIGATISTASADTISGDVDLQVKLPEILVLYHWEKAGIEFGANKYNLPTGKGEGTYDFGIGRIDVTDTNGGTSAGVTGQEMNTATVPNARADAQVIPVTLKNSWAVRTLTESGTVTLKIANTQGADVHTLSKDGIKSDITTKEVKVKTDTVGANSEITLPLNGKLPKAILLLI